MRIISWNVNGLRACWRKGMGEWLSQESAVVLGLQEVRCNLEQVPKELEQSPWQQHYSVARSKKGYSGVGLLGRRAPDEYSETLGLEEFDREGRFQLARFGDIWVANVYFPNGSGPNRDHSRVPYKIDFYAAVHKKLEAIRSSKEAIICMGDFNTAHREIDLARPKANRKTSGFLPEECAVLDEWLDSGWKDSLREIHGDSEGLYSWWSQRGSCRARNVGWRIDYLMLNDAAHNRLKDAFICPEVLGSDHCPIGVELS